MKLYDFELVKDGVVVATSSAVPLSDTAAAWPMIETMAATVEGSGFRIRVRDDEGGIVILTGVVSVRRLAKTAGAGLGP